jgi:hypothetical protein
VNPRGSFRPDFRIGERQVAIGCVAIGCTVASCHTGDTRAGSKPRRLRPARRRANRTRSPAEWHTRCTRRMHNYCVCRKELGAMSEQRAFVLSAIGIALLAPALALALVRSGPDYPHPLSSLVPVAKEPRPASPTIREQSTPVIRLAPIVITAPVRRPAKVATPRAPASDDCNAAWRPLAQGPAGRRVRELCR